MAPEGYKREARKDEEDEDKEQPRMTRRSFLKGAGAVATGAIVGATIFEGNEGAPRSEKWKKNIQGYQKLYEKVGEDEVLFVGDHGEPLSVEKVPKTGGSKKWFLEQRESLCKKYTNIICDPKKYLPRQLNVRGTLRAASRRGGKEFSPENYMDVVKHYGTRETKNGGGRSRIQYTHDEVSKSCKYLPESLQQELSKIAPGLGAQESGYDNGLRSRVGARGIFQFMPRTWRSFGYKPKDIFRLTNQVEAVGKYFDQSYRVVSKKAGKELEYFEKEVFRGDADVMRKEFLMPILVNAYNAGAGRLVAVLRWYKKEYEKGRLRPKGSYKDGYGHDLFFQMAESARTKDDTRLLSGYRDHAAEYTPRVYALAESIEKEGLFTKN